MTGAVIKRIAHADMDTQAADMRASADTTGSGTGSRAHRADLRACANLGIGGAPEQNRNGNYRSRQRFHFQILRDGEKCLRVQCQ